MPNHDESEVLYALFPDGIVCYYWPEDDLIQPLHDDDYVKFWALHNDDEGDAGDDDTDTESTASSEFVLDPEEIEDPIERPHTPEPAQCRDSEEEPTSHLDAEQAVQPRVSIEDSAWANHSFVDSDSRMGLRHEALARSGICAGRLAYCNWVGYTDRANTNTSASGVGIMLTTDEGNEYWLEDLTYYPYEFYTNGKGEYPTPVWAAAPYQVDEDVGGPDDEREDWEAEFDSQAVSLDVEITTYDMMDLGAPGDEDTFVGHQLDPIAEETEPESDEEEVPAVSCSGPLPTAAVDVDLGAPNAEPIFVGHRLEPIAEEREPVDEEPEMITKELQPCSSS